MESQGKVSERSGNSDMDNEWQPWYVLMVDNVSPPLVATCASVRPDSGFPTKSDTTGLYSHRQRLEASNVEFRK